MNYEAFTVGELLAMEEEKQKELDAIAQVRAEKQCPFKVGDVLRDQKGKDFKLINIHPDYLSWGGTIQPFCMDGTLAIKVQRLYGMFADRYERIPDECPA